MFRVPLPKLMVWSLLALPAAVLGFRYWLGEHPAELLSSSGDWSARLIIGALAVTPLAQLFPGSAAVRWLLRHRRALGVAAFAYALVHVVLYVLDVQGLANIIAELQAPAIWTAWLAFLCLVPPALISSNAAMRRLGTLWKRIQRLAYPAAILTLVHWMLVHDGLTEALIHFAPLALLQLVRLTRFFKPTPERKLA